MDSNLIARTAAESLLNTLPAGIAIALIAWIMTRTLRSFGASVRFGVWVVALAAILFLLGHGSSATSSSRVLPSPVGEAVTLPASLAIYLLVFWILGASFGLLRLVLSLDRLRRLRATCSPVEPCRLDPTLRWELEQVQHHREVTLCVSSTVRVPAALGYVRPMVVFPAWALAEMPVEQLRAVLLHELAHLRRYDDWTNLAQKLVKALLFFHPAVWFIESRLTLEREMACDDAVLAANFAPRTYAESLVNLAEKSFLHRGVQLAQAAVNHLQQLKLRLIEILDKNRAGKGSARPGKFALGLMAVVAAMTVYGGTRAPRLIAFSDGSVPAVSLAASLVSHQVSEIELHTVSFAEPRASKHVQAKTRPRIAQTTTAEPWRIVAQYRSQNELGNGGSAAPPTVLADYPKELSAAPLLIVFHGEQFGPDGRIFWRIMVLHLTPTQQQVLSEGLPKKI